MNRSWKKTVDKVMSVDCNIRHSCTSSHGFMRGVAHGLYNIAKTTPEERAKWMACVRGVPLLFSTGGLAQNHYALIFLWDQPMEDIMLAATTLRMRAWNGATLCRCYVSKNVRDKLGTAAWTGHGIDRAVSAQFELAYFLTTCRKDNIDV
jgi:hypothetical protein